MAGSLELRSGTWDWELFDASVGTTVVFRHRRRVREEMRAWIPNRAPTAEELRDHARSPVTRVWVDIGGIRWELTLERPAASRREFLRAPQGGEDSRWLVFRSGARRVVSLVPSDTRLGELTPAELEKLLNG